jgi:hypothetical protein
MTHARCLTLVTTLSLLALSTAWTHAATFTCQGGDTACLIAAIQAANASADPDTIRLATGTYIFDTAHHEEDGEAYALPTVTTPLDIRGAGALATILDRPLATALSLFGFLRVSEAGRLALVGLTLQGGSARSAGGAVLNRGWLSVDSCIIRDGGAIGGAGLLNWAGAEMAVVGSTITGNSAFLGAGGGIFNSGLLTVERSVFTFNAADSSGGGLYNDGTATITNSTIAGNGGGEFGFGGGGGITNGGTLTVRSSTIVDNAASSVYGGIAGPATLQGTILARNMSLGRPTFGPDCSAMISEGHNLIGDPTNCEVTLQPTDRTGDPGLGAFVASEAPGQAHYPLLATSQAVDAGGTSCTPTDQLGNPRSGPCDIGAIEFQHAPVDVVSLRQAVFLNRSGQLLVVATSSESPAATLSLTVPGCVQESPLTLFGHRYVFLQPVPSCGVLDGQAITVRSSLGGVAEGVIR